MKKVDEQRHFLALLKRPGDYVFIAISKLDIANGIPRISLQAIDSFAMNFTIDEIIQSIKRANIVSEEYLNGQLVIQDNQKHNPIEVIDRDFYDNFRIDLFLKDQTREKANMARSRAMKELWQNEFYRQEMIKRMRTARELKRKVNPPKKQGKEENE